MGMTCRPETTAASAALSDGTRMPTLPSARARKAIGRMPLTGRTPPVGLLPPHYSSPPVLDFIAFSTITPLPNRTQNSGRTSSQKEGRHATVHDTTGKFAWIWNQRLCHRKMGKEPKPPDRGTPEAYY